MVKSIKSTTPNVKQTLELLAGKPSKLQMLTNPPDPKKKPTMLSVANLMNCTYSSVLKIVKALKDGLDPYLDLGWSAGRPLKDWGLTHEQTEWIISRRTLRSQAGKSLPTRAMIANLRFGSNLKTNDLRKLYKINRITRQRMVSQVKPSRQMPVDDQVDKLKKINAELKYHISEGREVFVYDECVFSAKSFK